MTFPFQSVCYVGSDSFREVSKKEALQAQSVHFVMFALNENVQKVQFKQNKQIFVLNVALSLRVPCWEK